MKNILQILLILLALLSQSVGYCSNSDIIIAPNTTTTTNSNMDVDTEAGGFSGLDNVPEVRRNRLLDELDAQGIKYNADDVVDIRRTSDGRNVFLETGNENAGLRHITSRHADDFANRGILEHQIPDAVMTAVTRGKVIGYQGKGKGRPIYEFSFNGQTQRMAVTVGDNGFIVGANPAK